MRAIDPDLVDRESWLLATTLRHLVYALPDGGRALVMVPVGEGRTETYEDPSVTDPADRQRLFWQYDHLRIYGSDVADRLCDAGFEVCYVDLLAELGEERVQLHRVRKRDRWGPDQIYDCLKPLA